MRPFLIIVAILATGCDYSSDVVTVRFRDLRQVAVVPSAPVAPPTTAGGDIPPAPGALTATDPLPAPPGDTDSPLGQGLFATSGSTATDYTVRALRPPDGSITVRWETRVALTNGEYYTLLAEPTLSVDASTGYQLWGDWMRGRPRYHLHACTALAPVTSRSTLVGYAVTGTVPCAPPLAPSTVEFSLDTPWSNVAEIRRDHVVDRAGAQVALWLGTILFGGLAVVMLIVGAVSHPVDVGWLAAGAITGGLTVLLDIPSIIAMGQSDHSTVLYH